MFAFIKKYKTALVAVAALGLIAAAGIGPALIMATSIEMGSAGTTDTTITRASAGVIAVEGVSLSAGDDSTGKQSIFIGAGAMVARATSGADCTVLYDSGASDVTIRTCQYLNAADSHAQFIMRMPKQWDEGTLTFVPIWTAIAGSAAQTVDWEFSCLAISDDDTLNASMGTATASNDAYIAANDQHTGAETSATTCAGTPAVGDLVVINVMRDVSDGTLAQTVQLLGFTLHWTNNAATSD